MSAFPEVEQRMFSRPAQAHGLATPQSSPLLADQEDFGSDLDVQEVPQEYDVGNDSEEVSPCTISGRVKPRQMSNRSLH